jgi:hypothetical protein
MDLRALGDAGARTLPRLTVQQVSAVLRVKHCMGAWVVSSLELPRKRKLY